jgi:hypothetical protein
MAKIDASGFPQCSGARPEASTPGISLSTKVCSIASANESRRHVSFSDFGGSKCQSTPGRKKRLPPLTWVTIWIFSRSRGP